MENKAKIAFQKSFKCVVEPCGRIVDEHLHYLAASPDKIIKLNNF